ncbi:hypothetical protein D9M72_630520 [compost metagenome]
MLVLRADCRQSCVDILQTQLNLLKKDDPGLGQFDTSIDSVEQSSRQLLLQALDLLADRRLCGAQLDRRRREAALTGRRLESTK